MRGSNLQVVTDEPPVDPETERRRQAKMRAALLGITQRLSKEAEMRVGLKRDIEQRWLEDLRQYHGRYDDQITKALGDTKKSQVFMNSTRPKTNTMAARLCDLLFPTDDKNWGIQPTPVPELAADAESAVERVKQAIEEAQMAEAAEAAAQPPPAAADPNAPVDPAQAAPPMPSPNIMAARQKVIDAEDVVKSLRAAMDEAQKRAKSMTDEIDDQLKECRYQTEARDMIEDGCKLGTGVIKGPIVDGKTKRKWKEVAPEGDPGAMPAQQSASVYALDTAGPKRPAFIRVDPWHFFPEPGSRTVADSDDFFERHLMTESQLRKLAKNPTFDKDAIRRLLQGGTRLSPPEFITDLRSLTRDTIDTGKNQYFHVWEYHGAIAAEDFETLALALGKPDHLDELPEETDPLFEMPVTIWFCDNEVLKFGIHPLDSCEPIYSVFNLDKDEASIWGYGIPYLMRDSQRAANGAWRMMLDNGGLSTGPQILIDQSLVKPADGKYELKPRKIWLYNSQTAAGARPFETFDIASHQAELAGIVELAMRFMDTETALPPIAMGEQGTQTTQTMGGMSILMNSANVVFRRIVKCFDDDVTTPNIRRIYDWNMQYSEKDHIKGDYEVDARGSSVLLVREMQAQNLMNIAIQLGGHPVYGAMLKNRDLLAEIFATHMLSPDKFVLEQDEIDKNAAASAASPDQDPSVIIAREANDLKATLTEMEWDGRKYVADKQHESAMAALAVQGNTTLDKVEADMQKRKEDRDSEERMFAAELAKTDEIGPSGGGNF